MGGEWNFTYNTDSNDLEKYQELLLRFESGLDELLPLFDLTRKNVVKDLSANVFLQFQREEINRSHFLPQDFSSVNFLWNPSEGLDMETYRTYPHLKSTDYRIQLLCLPFQKILHLLGYAILSLNPNENYYTPCIAYHDEENRWTVCKNSLDSPFSGNSYNIFKYFEILGLKLEYCNCPPEGRCQSYCE